MPEGPLFKGAPPPGGPGGGQGGGSGGGQGGDSGGGKGGDSGGGKGGGSGGGAGEGGGEKAAGSTAVPSFKGVPPPGAKAQDAAVAAQNTFAKTPPSAIIACPLPAKPGKKGPPAKKAPPPAWTAKDLTDALKECDGGTDAFKKSEKATIRIAPSVIGTGGHADSAKNEVVIDPPPKFGRCEQIETLVHELTNLSNAKKFDNTTNQCLVGDLGREAYIKANEEIEYDGVKTALKAFDACHKQWKCKTASFEWVRPFKDFDHYYKSISKGHKEHFGKWWDASCKAPFIKKHPPPKKAPPPPKKGLPPPPLKKAPPPPKKGPPPAPSK